MSRVWRNRALTPRAFKEAVERSRSLHHELHLPDASTAKVHELRGAELLSGTAWSIPDLGSTSLRCRAVVYAISTRTRMLYVGSTTQSARQRLTNHHVICLDERRLRPLVLGERDLVRFFCCRDAGVALLLECAMRRWFHPEWNDVPHWMP